MKSSLPGRTLLISVLLLHAFVAGNATLRAQATAGGIAPRSLMPDNPAQIAPSTSGGQVTQTLGKEGIDLAIQPGPDGYPGVVIHPAQGKTWDLSPFGRVDARVTNTGSQPLLVIVRVDNEGDWHNSPWNAESARLKPNETRTIKIYFGYSGGKPAFKLKPEAVSAVLFMTDKVATPSSFRIQELWASGSAGEKPPPDPNSIRTKPENGIIFGPEVKFDPAGQVDVSGGAQASVDPETKGLRIAFPTGKSAFVTLKPPAGQWSFADYNEVKIKLKNTGPSPVAPAAHLSGGTGTTDTVPVNQPIAPGAEAEIVVPFAPASPWFGVEKSPGKVEPAPGTGTMFTSNGVRGITIGANAGAATSIEVLSITADAPPADLPPWLGQRPPVDGDWVKTFDDEFDGTSIDLKKWNTWTVNIFDKRSRFTPDSLILKNGELHVRYEKKTGRENDSPKGRETEYAGASINTFGKWTQRYGYFEARMKLPKAPGLWPAFWLMPDRGIGNGPQWVRGDTAKGGMEFDITEYLSGWGPYRYNIACHWDGYNKDHKATGSPWNYMQTDKDGYITTGMLWTPGEVVFYCNGKETLRWRNPRVSSITSYIIINLVSGGWDNAPLDDSKLPDDWVIDYIRVWQRKDLASDVDGPKPNDGGLNAPGEKTDN